MHSILIAMESHLQGHQDWMTGQASSTRTDGTCPLLKHPSDLSRGRPHFASTVCINLIWPFNRLYWWWCLLSIEVFVRFSWYHNVSPHGVWRIRLGSWLGEEDPIRDHDVMIHGTEQEASFSMKCYTRFLERFRITPPDSDCSLASVFHKRRRDMRVQFFACSTIVALEYERVISCFTL